MHKPDAAKICTVQMWQLLWTELCLASWQYGIKLLLLHYISLPAFFPG